jgi:hypothetical protein
LSCLHVSVLLLLLLLRIRTHPHQGWCLAAATAALYLIAVAQRQCVFSSGPSSLRSHQHTVCASGAFHQCPVVCYIVLHRNQPWRLLSTHVKHSCTNQLTSALLLLLLLQIRTQPHLGSCLAAATAAASAIFVHLCTNSVTQYTSRQHIRSCNDVNLCCYAALLCFMPCSYALDVSMLLWGTERCFRCL